MTKEGVGHRIKFPRHAAFVYKQAHQDKQRHNREAVILGGIGDLTTDHRHGGFHAAFRQKITASFPDDAKGADKPHGKHNRDPQQNKDQNKGKANKCSSHYARSSSLGAKRIIRPVPTIMTPERATEAAMNQPT